jgi:hypothetical protein
MDRAELGLLDGTLVVIYLLGVMGLGLWMSRGIKSSASPTSGPRT